MNCFSWLLFVRISLCEGRISNIVATNNIFHAVFSVAISERYAL